MNIESLTINALNALMSFLDGVNFSVTMTGKEKKFNYIRLDNSVIIESNDDILVRSLGLYWSNYGLDLELS
jgi:hypothetical protein